MHFLKNYFSLFLYMKTNSNKHLHWYFFCKEKLYDSNFSLFSNKCNSISRDQSVLSLKSPATGLNFAYSVSTHMHLHPLCNCHRRTYSSLFGSLCFLCVYKCLCLFIVCAGMYMWMWRPEVDIRCHQISSSLLFILIFETYSLIEVGVQ